MKTLILISSLLLSLTLHAQTTSYISNDTFYFDNNIYLVEGQDIKLGTGTMPDGDFKYITTSRNNWAAASSDGKLYNVGAKWSGHFFRIKRIYEYGNKRRGYTTYLILGGGNLVNYECDVINAIKSGEIEIAGYTPHNGQAVIIQQPVSKADELKKLKDLKDQGILTEEEFQEEKKKILSK